MCVGYLGTRGDLLLDLRIADVALAGRHQYLVASCPEAVDLTGRTRPAKAKADDLPS